MRSRACAPLSPSPPRRYLATSSRARTAWVMSSSIRTAWDYNMRRHGGAVPEPPRLPTHVLAARHGRPEDFLTGPEPALRRRRTAVDRTADRGGVLRRARRAAEVARAHLAGREHAGEGLHDTPGRRALVDVAQHQHRGQQQSRGVRDVLAGDVRG